MSDRRTLSSSLSAMVVQHLVAEGHSQSRIARMLGVSEAYVSLVKSRERSLTLDHIERISEWLQMPIGAFFMAAGPKPKKNASPKLKRLYRISTQVMILADKAVETIINSTGRKRSGKRKPLVSLSRRGRFHKAGRSSKSPGR